VGVAINSPGENPPVGLMKQVLPEDPNAGILDDNILPGTRCVLCMGEGDIMVLVTGRTFHNPEPAEPWAGRTVADVVGIEKPNRPGPGRHERIG
jgi:hypothetical protein